MPAKSTEYWSARSGKVGTTWYQDLWLDWWSQVLWRHAVRRLRPPFEDAYVLDVGCGDGVCTVWVADYYDCVVQACDLFPYKAHYHPNVFYEFGVDAEVLSQGRWFDAALISGVLECVDDWRKVLRAAMSVTDKIVLVEDLRIRKAPYQVGLPHKTAILWGEVLDEVSAAGWRVARWGPVTIVDRALVVWAPAALRSFVVLVSAILDLALVHVPFFKRWTRVRACYLEKRKDEI